MIDTKYEFLVAIKPHTQDYLLSSTQYNTSDIHVYLHYQLHKSVRYVYEIEHISINEITN